MLQNYGLSQIFYTMTMDEDKWTHLKKILETTGDYFERDKFQNRGTIHTYRFVYTELKIPELIELKTIRADMPNPITEQVLFQLVSTFQVHQCIKEKCGGPETNLNPCKKGFPQPLSNYTYCNTNSK
ncbi:ATP-dependent DNA helicase pif1-like [Gigaspora margarita]|uniref:ATP-dependent DNA helicase pif1-like n=1 Tax=Gigaspora margarita TaxID=4874 RepID=A0A8H4A5G3_GIGMA|nr:ATP-dependent DNA helicase pif1-like [Gigaspora margarita]